ncbi:MAG: hypothetical protein AAFW67_12710 [Cyanobacteria bacterium J06638_38]
MLSKRNQDLIKEIQDIKPVDTVNPESQSRSDLRETLREVKENLKKLTN